MFGGREVLYGDAGGTGNGAALFGGGISGRKMPAGGSASRGVGIYKAIDGEAQAGTGAAGVRRPGEGWRTAAKRPGRAMVRGARIGKIARKGKVEKIWGRR